MNLGGKIATISSPAPHPLPLWSGAILFLPVSVSGLYLIWNSVLRFFPTFPESGWVSLGLGTTLLLVGMLCLEPSFRPYTAKIKSKRRKAYKTKERKQVGKDSSIPSQEELMVSEVYSDSLLLSISLFPALLARAVFLDFRYPRFTTAFLFGTAILAITRTLYSMFLEFRLWRSPKGLILFSSESPPPFHPGSSFSLVFRPGSGLEEMGKLVATCSFLRESREIHDSKTPSEEWLVWQERKLFSFDDIGKKPEAGGQSSRKTEIASTKNTTDREEATLTFTLPSNLPGTDLHCPEPRYWLLDVSATLHGGKHWKRSYFLPVARGDIDAMTGCSSLGSP